LAQPEKASNLIGSAWLGLVHPNPQLGSTREKNWASSGGLAPAGSGSWSRRNTKRDDASNVESKVILHAIVLANLLALALSK